MFGHPVGIGLASGVAVVGLMMAADVARAATTRDNGVVVGCAALALAAGIYWLGRSWSWLSSMDGMVVVHDDHLTVWDDVLLDAPIVVRRSDVLDVAQLTPQSPPPTPGTHRAESVVGRLVRGGHEPNVEIWMTDAAVLPPVLAGGARVATRLQILTPGAGELLRWYSGERLRGINMFHYVDVTPKPWEVVRMMGSYCHDEDPAYE